MKKSSSNNHWPNLLESIISFFDFMGWIFGKHTPLLRIALLMPIHHFWPPLNYRDTEFRLRCTESVGGWQVMVGPPQRGTWLIAIPTVSHNWTWAPCGDGWKRYVLKRQLELKGSELSENTKTSNGRTRYKGDKGLRPSEPENLIVWEHCFPKVRLRCTGVLCLENL